MQYVSFIPCLSLLMRALPACFILVNDQDTYGYALLGQTSNEAQRVAITVDRIDEPDVRRFPNSAAQLNATLTIDNLEPGVSYLLYRWDVLPQDSALPAFTANGTVPFNVQDYSNSKYTSRTQFIATAASWAWEDSKTILSSGATYYRCVAE